MFQMLGLCVCYIYGKLKVSDDILYLCYQSEHEASDSHFLGLVQNLLRDPKERSNFFQVSLIKLAFYYPHVSICVGCIQLVFETCDIGSVSGCFPRRLWAHV